MINQNKFSVSTGNRMDLTLLPQKGLLAWLALSRKGTSKRVPTACCAYALCVHNTVCVEHSFPTHD